jgi:hypothetical protein
VHADTLSAYINSGNSWLAKWLLTSQERPWSVGRNVLRLKCVETLAKAKYHS